LSVDPARIADILAEVLSPALVWLDYAGVFVFAASGALLAAKKQQTLVTFLFFAVITGVGGGTTRDLLIGAPVFWIGQNAMVLVCIGAALLVWLLPRRVLEGKLLDWLDAGGLAAYASFGAAKGLAFGVAPIPAIGMGVLTACLGGIIRDVLAGEPSILMRPELYVTAAALSAALTVGLILLGLPVAVAGAIAFAAGFGLRALAILRGWSLPAYDR
jgi:uncharacterized membrane protein YeiH